MELSGAKIRFYLPTLRILILHASGILWREYSFLVCRKWDFVVPLIVFILAI